MQRNTVTPHPFEFVDPLALPSPPRGEGQAIRIRVPAKRYRGPLSGAAVGPSPGTDEGNGDGRGAIGVVVGSEAGASAAVFLLVGCFDFATGRLAAALRAGFLARLALRGAGLRAVFLVFFAVFLAAFFRFAVVLRFFDPPNNARTVLRAFFANPANAIVNLPW